MAAATGTNKVFNTVSLSVPQNNSAHHTSVISVKDLIVRRGQYFKLSLVLSQPVLTGQSVVFTAKTGKHPSEDLGTQSVFGIGPNAKPSPTAKAVWKMDLSSTSNLQQGNLIMTMTPPANAPVGQYDLFVKHRDQEALLTSLVVLFNPWNLEDSVYLANDDEKEEYVLAEEGKIYYGSSNYINGMEWDYGQFEEKMVDICLAILDHNTKNEEDPSADVAARCDPIYVGRVISAMINSQDDNGVLIGNWSGDFSDGTSPTHWTRSYSILLKWFENGFKSVKYGQCWVFAAVMCTVMRCLGIPTRVVTNFTSAHDTNANLIIDKYCDEDGAEIRRGGDSIWNFHVWCEGWMKRPDLSTSGDLDGWQVVDPTPQERSDGLYRCGPASVNGIKEGKIGGNYDAPFVFAEVNADVITWEVKSDGSMAKAKTDTKIVGKFIYTKAVKKGAKASVLSKYKYLEGSQKERIVFYTASKIDNTNDTDEEEEEEEEPAGEDTGDDSTGGTEEPQPEQPPFTIEFVELARPRNGEDVNLKLVLHSKSTVAIPLLIKISVQAMRYNDTPAALIQKNKTDETLLPMKDLEVPILVRYLDYHKHMITCESMKVSALIEDKRHEDDIYFAEDNVVLLDPPIELTMPSAVRMYRPSHGKLLFKNTLQETLTNVTITLSGNGLYHTEQTARLEGLKPGEMINAMFYFIPFKTGQKHLVAVIDSNTLRDVKGKCTVNVFP